MFQFRLICKGTVGERGYIYTCNCGVDVYVPPYLGVDESGSRDGAVCLQDLHELLSRFHVAAHIVTVVSEPDAMNEGDPVTLVSGDGLRGAGRGEGERGGEREREGGEGERGGRGRERGGEK